jgi:hypothetical protein
MMGPRQCWSSNERLPPFLLPDVALGFRLVDLHAERTPRHGGSEGAECRKHLDRSEHAVLAERLYECRSIVSEASTRVVPACQPPRRGQATFLPRSVPSNGTRILCFLNLNRDDGPESTLFNPLNRSQHALSQGGMVVEKYARQY